MSRRIRPKPEFAMQQRVEQMWEKFEYPDIDPDQLPFELGGGGGGAPTVVVAASDASDLSKSKADYICPGVNDDQVIQGAINVMPGFGIGGRVLLTEGTFECQYGGITADVFQAVTIQGMGHNSTRVRFDGSSGNGFDISVGGDVIRDLLIQDTGSGTGAGIRLHSSQGARIENVVFDNTGTGVEIANVSSAAREVLITRCFFRTGGVGIDATPSASGRGLTVVANNFENTGDTAIHCAVIEGVMIADNFINIFTGTGIDGILIDDCNGLTISGNWIEARRHAIILEQSVNRCTITGNVLRGSTGVGAFMNNDDVGEIIIDSNTFHNSNGAIAAPDGAYRVTVSNNQIDNSIATNTDAAIQFAYPIGPGPGGYGLDIRGNTIEFADANGIGVEDYFQVAIRDNEIIGTDQHGISLQNVTDALVSGNRLDQTGAEGSHDGIILVADVDRGYVTGNVVVPAAGVPNRYGINVAAASCVCNIVVGNQLGDPGDYGTDALNDAGTDTQLTYPNDATYGDNFTDCGTSPGSPTSP